MFPDIARLNVRRRVDFRRSCMIGVLLFLVTALAFYGAAYFARSADGLASGAEPSQRIKPVDWALLRNQDGDCLQVTKLRLIMYEKKNTTEWTSYLARGKRCEIETQDELFLSVIPSFLNMSLRSACPETPEYDYAWTSAEECVGEFHVTTKTHAFMIGITPCGFALQSKEMTYRNTLNSWGVATVIDRILREHGEQGLSDQLFKKLSPEGLVEVEKRHMKTFEDQIRHRAKNALER